MSRHATGIECAAVLLATFVIAAILFERYPLDDKAAFAPSLIMVGAILAIHMAGKGAFAHKAEHHRTTALDILLERVALPAATIAIALRYSNLSVDAASRNLLVWALALLLADATNSVKLYLRRTRSIQSGHFLRGLITESPRSDADYIPIAFFVGVAYIALWW